MYEKLVIQALIWFLLCIYRLWLLCTHKWNCWSLAWFSLSSVSETLFTRSYTDIEHLFPVHECIKYASGHTHCVDFLHLLQLTKHSYSSWKPAHRHINMLDVGCFFFLVFFRCIISINPIVTKKERERDSAFLSSFVRVQNKFNIWCVEFFHY